MEAQVPGARGGDRWLGYLGYLGYLGNQASLWQRTHHEIGVPVVPWLVSALRACFASTSCGSEGLPMLRNMGC